MSKNENELALLNSNNLTGISDLCLYLGLKESRIRYEVFLSRIPHLKISRSIRFSKTAIDQWLLSKTKGGQE